MELWDVYDKDRILTGKTAVRGKALERGGYHMVVHICIFNKKGEMLIQQRQSFKPTWPDLWDITVGGSAVMGDSSQTAAERELMEELGYKANLQGVRPRMTINFEEGFDDFYLIEDDVKLEELCLQYEEVQDVRWATREEILGMIEERVFIPYFADVINLLFSMRRGYGSHREGPPYGGEYGK